MWSFLRHTIEKGIKNCSEPFRITLFIFIHRFSSIQTNSFNETKLNAARTITQRIFECNFVSDFQSGWFLQDHRVIAQFISKIENVWHQRNSCCEIIERFTYMKFKARVFIYICIDSLAISYKSFQSSEWKNIDINIIRR